MYFTVKNNMLAAYMEFLQELKLKAQASRGRSKIVDLLNEKNNEFQKDVTELQQQYFQTDEKGNFKLDKHKKLILKDGLSLSSAQKELDELNDEEIRINLGEYAERIKTLYSALTSYDYDLDGKDAILYDRLMDQLEDMLHESVKEC